MPLEDVSRRREPEAQAREVAPGDVAGPEESPADRLQILPRNPDAMVSDRDAVRPCVGQKLDLDVSATG